MTNLDINQPLIDKTRTTINSMNADDKCCGGCCNPGHGSAPEQIGRILANKDLKLAKTFTTSGKAVKAEKPAGGISASGETLQAFLLTAKKQLNAVPESRGKSPFDKVLEARLAKTREILTAKEYVSSGDRFHNFKVAAQMENKTPEQTLYGMMLKYMVSVKDLVDWSGSDPERITAELVDEKIGDHCNYLILLEGLLLERINGNEHKIITAGRE